MESKRSFMESKIIAMLVVGIIVGVCVGYGAAYLVFTPKINELKIQLSGYELQYETLSGQYETLTGEYEDLTGEYEDLETEMENLQSQYTALSTEYSALQSDYSLLTNEYEEVSAYLRGLSSDVQGIIDLLTYYSSVPEAFRYTLNDEELEKIASTVETITLGSANNWYAYEKIYKHVAYQINYAPDIEFPYVGEYHHLTVDGDEIITGFSVDTTMNYVQKPDFTLSYKQGDCEDQVILLYAMIKYYERNIYETEYTTYIAYIEFTADNPHLSIFLPVMGGRTKENKLCILDPAGRYFTNKYGDIIQREIPVELEVYSKAWKAAGVIKHIKLYDVDVTDGSYTVVASGNLEEITEFLEAL